MSTNEPGWPDGSLPDDDEVLTRKELAKLLKCSVAKLERMALDGSGPPYSPLDKNKKRAAVRYLRGDVKAWLRSCRRSSTSDRGQS